MFFSKRLWVEPLLHKAHDSVLKGFQNIFGKTPRRSTLVRTDQGQIN